MGHNFEVKKFGDIILMFCYRCGRTYRLYTILHTERWEQVNFLGQVPVSECEKEEDEIAEGENE